MIERMNEYLNSLFKLEVKLSYSREADLSTNAFLSGGTAVEAAKLINKSSHPFIDRAWAKSGWVLIKLNSTFYDHLLKNAAVDVPPSLNQSHLENRLRLWLRYGEQPCPKDERVRRVLLRCALGLATDKEILQMSHHLDGIKRIELERSLGGVAKAILNMKKHIHN